MDWLRVLISRFAGLFSKRKLDAELDEELRSHIDMAVEEHRRRGLSERDARTQALREFGGVTQARERYREQRGFPSPESLWRDIRHGQRQFRKTPGFTIAAICTLALGIGANLTVFLVLYGVVLRPLPFPQPNRLVQIDAVPPNGDFNSVLTATEALFLSRNCKACESAATYDLIPAKLNLVQGSGATPLQVQPVTAGFFHVFGMEPVLGRGFDARDMVANAPGTVVLSDALWRHHFGADPGILGKDVTLGNKSYTVIGVANPKFSLENRTEAWVPLPIMEHANDQNHMYVLVMRLKPGVTMAQANADLKQVLREYRRAYPNTWGKNVGITAEGLHAALTGKLRPALEMLMGAVLLVLLIVAANILGLLLTRAVARRHEMGVRTALGATGLRMLRQLLVENLMLCAAGGAAGAVAAWLLTPVLMRLSPLQLPVFASLGMGRPALLLAVVLTLVCALIFSLVPAMETRRSRLSDSLRLNATRVAAGRHVAQRVLVVGQVAVSLVLLVGAAMLLTTFWKLMHVAPGFRAENVLTFKTSLPSGQVGSGLPLAERVGELAARVEALPGVESAASVLALPTQLTPNLQAKKIGAASNQSQSMFPDYLPVTRHYFKALRIPLIAGRAFRGSDSAGAMPVVIVNQNLARTYYKGENPIGRHILIGAGLGPAFMDHEREIVGVVGDVKQAGMDRPAPAITYLPAAQEPTTIMQMQTSLLGESWVVRMKRAHVNVLPEIRQIFMKDAHAPLLNVESMDAVMRASVASQRFSMILLCLFGLIALVMSGAGLYGVMSYNVARRRKEIGVRMALGARREDVARSVLKDAGWLVGIGLVIGIVTSLAAGKLISSLLFGVKPQAPLALVVAAVVMLLTGLFAAWWPALRAAGVEPMEALRNE